MGICHTVTITEAGVQWKNFMKKARPKSVHEDRIYENFAINGFELDADDMKQIEDMDTETDMILDITSMDEVYRLYNIRFEQ